MKARELSEGIIRRDELYTLARLKACLGLTESALRSLRIAGLPVIRFGKRGFISGQKAIEFLEQYDDRNQSQSRLPQRQGLVRPSVAGSGDGLLEGEVVQDGGEEGGRKGGSSARS